MVLTNLPFAAPDLLHSRYSSIELPGSTSSFHGLDDDKDKITKNYAAFLKEHERKCGPDGYLDSKRYTNTFLVRQAKEKPPQGGSDSGSKPRSTVDLIAKTDKDRREFDKRMKVIEDHMWQHKQEERELKRVEGDIVKNQRAVRRTLRDYENSITKKRMNEEKKLNQGLEKYTKLQRNFIHKKEDLTKQRIESGVSLQQAIKDRGRKVQLTTSDLARQYRTKMAEIDLKRVEVMRLSEQYEEKMKSKEHEQFKLKQELAELAIALNMEVHKGRVMKTEVLRSHKKEQDKKIDEDLSTQTTLENKLGKSDGDTKSAEMNRRKLSADLTLTRAHMSIKQREEGRHLQDTRSRLADNTGVQKQLNEAALHADLDLKAKKIDQKVQAHDKRKQVRLRDSLQARQEKEEAQSSMYKEKFKRRAQEHSRREHEDHLRHFQKSVSKGEDTEHQLFQIVRNSEYGRQKQEQSVRRTQQKLEHLRSKNALRIKQEIAEAYRKEKDMQSKLIREQSDLAKVHNQREESYIKLQHHRGLLREDKYQLTEHEREHNRLLRVGARSESYLPDAF